MLMPSTLFVFFIRTSAFYHITSTIHMTTLASRKIKNILWIKTTIFTHCYLMVVYSFSDVEKLA
jgi:hypothetical protein